MEIDAVDTAPAKVDADVLAFAVPDPVDLPAKAQEIDGLLEGELGHLIEDGELKGKLGKTTFTHTEGRLAAHRVAAAGVGSPEDLDADALRTAAAAVAIHAGEVGGKSIAWILDGESSTLSAAEQARAIVDGTVLGPYDAGRWKTGENERRHAIERLVFCGPGASALAEDAQRANVVVSWTNRCRDFVNAPPNECTPARLAEWAEETAGRFDSLSFEALGPDEIRSAGMGALAAVSQGSHNPPRLIKLSYEPSDAKGDLVLGLVGKAITFDAGGLSLKPADRMEEMKSDMGGGAAVLAAVGAIAELGLPVRLLAVVPSCENMPGGHAYRPGDIITALNGKTIEVTNTDAEGRLILADALWHARQSGATHIIDLATLTDGRLLRGPVRKRRGLAAHDSRSRRGERRPRLDLAAARDLPPLHRLELRGHEEFLGLPPGLPHPRRSLSRGIRRRRPVGAPGHRRHRVPRARPRRLLRPRRRHRLRRAAALGTRAPPLGDLVLHP